MNTISMENKIHYIFEVKNNGQSIFFEVIPGFFLHKHLEILKMQNTSIKLQKQFSAHSSQVGFSIEHLQTLVFKPSK